MPKGKRNAWIVAFPRSKYQSVWYESRYVKILLCCYQCNCGLRQKVHAILTPFFFSFNKVSPTAPSPVASYDGYCVQPEDGSCSPQDGTAIKFGEKGSCSNNFMEFSLDANGVLRHHCSGKMVCPENGNSGAAIKVNSGCTEEDSKFERTAGESGFQPGLAKFFILFALGQRTRRIWPRTSQKLSSRLQTQQCGYFPTDNSTSNCKGWSAQKSWFYPGLV